MLVADLEVYATVRVVQLGYRFSNQRDLKALLAVNDAREQLGMHAIEFVGGVDEDAAALEEAWERKNKAFNHEIGY